jgi:uncharacterized protein YndB with AHSA1/START domain
VSVEAPTAVVRRVLPAPPDVVYREWIDPEAMMEWMCPRPARPTKITLEPRVGGRLRIDIDDEGLALSIEGEYLELDPPRRLRFTWSCTTWDPPADSVVTVSFEPHGDDDTLMTIEHVRLPGDVVERHRHGWSLIGEQLESHLGAAHR